MNKRVRHVIAALVALLGGAAAVAAPPRRIVSLNLCTDQLVLALADRGQIAALSRNATDPAMSAAAAQARGLRRLSDAVEQVLAIDPDLVVGASPARAALLAQLGGRPVRALDLSYAQSYADIVAQIRAMAEAVGHADRGAALVARMDAALAHLPQVGAGRIAADYQRRGYLTGTGTLVDELMGRVGLVNLARRLGKPALAQVSLEAMVAAQPDYLIVARGSAHVADQGTEMLHHPALAGIPRLYLPEAWTVCGGPAYVDAAWSLARQIEGRRTPHQKATRTPP
ncbi:ABC transporter substrate-binding protein [Sphingomonas nostoxanthinifaciens]|uniref:ABC transporter substrate-binding protein n=1 Tax=Sphingomonas nostoxanthinifaciens TaxID=2872652 RepID=UPI001CC1C9B2|nr:ABC transporter substrate-binding protein [Sphingomonas nostoxanthinifaciens]